MVATIQRLRSNYCDIIFLLKTRPRAPVRWLALGPDSVTTGTSQHTPYTSFA
ncbi:hypothetical protein ACFOQM_08400 [Paenibacillus sp. GCM10012307]|uniref:hypothetical protein n=1 Tax=Paenibacillus sp. GCM10012307 TaxID=3317343 RepID=UPI0036193956